MLPVRPIIHPSGNGLGHHGSISNFGALTCASTDTGDTGKRPIAASHAHAKATKTTVFVISDPHQTRDVSDRIPGIGVLTSRTTVYSRGGTAAPPPLRPRMRRAWIRSAR